MKSVAPHLRRLLPYLSRHRQKLLWGLLCLLLTTLFSVISPWVLRHAVDDLALELTRSKLRLYAGLLLLVVVIEGIFRYLMRQVLISLSREIEYELRNDLFSHLTRLPARYFQSNRVGDLMSRATSDISAVRMVLGPAIMYSANTAATFLGTVVLMLVISPTLLALALVPLFLISFLVRHFGRQIHDRQTEVQAKLSDLSALVQENLSGARVVRAYAQESFELQHFESVNREYVASNRRLIMVYGSLYPAIQLLMGASAATVLFLGGRMAVLGGITVGEFVAFTAYLAMLHWPMVAVGWVVNIFERGEASMGRIVEVLDAPPEIADRGTEAALEVRGALEFRHLDFGYQAGQRVLHDVNLSVPAGATVAVVGPTGSGKSTLVSLIPRLFEAPPGSVLLDGIDVREIPLSTLRGAVGFVPQETFLFSTTVGENVAFGLTGVAAGDQAERVRWASSVAQLAKDVDDFPKGYETLVGERGLTLSGGQKQRTALARALATDPRVLILDDSLSSVDTYTEEEILKGLRGVRQTRTTFVVSHRVSTVKDADLIVVLREGRIVEQGTHEELLGRDGFYADLHSRQLLEQEMEVA